MYCTSVRLFVCDREGNGKDGKRTKATKPAQVSHTVRKVKRTCVMRMVFLPRSTRRYKSRSGICSRRIARRNPSPISCTSTVILFVYKWTLRIYHCRYVWTRTTGGRDRNELDEGRRDRAEVHNCRRRHPEEQPIAACKQLSNISHQSSLVRSPKMLLFNIFLYAFFLYCALCFTKLPFDPNWSSAFLGRS